MDAGDDEFTHPSTRGEGWELLPLKIGCIIGLLTKHEGFLSICVC